MGLTHDEQVAMLVSLLCMLGLGRLLGELAMRLKQPCVLGEILAGVLLGKTVLGRAWPAAWKFLFNPDSPNGIAVIRIGTLAVTFFMLVAGIEMSLNTVMRRIKQSVVVSAGGIIVPFVAGFLLAYFTYSKFDPPATVKRFNFAFIIGVAMSITALPIVAKTLRDLHLYRTDMGMTVMAAATIDDLLGWALFAVSISISGGTSHGPGLIPALVLLPVFVVGMLIIGRWIFNLILPWVQAYLSWPGGVFGFIGTVSLASASFAQYIGVHSTLGAFMTGVALGDSMHLRDKTRGTLDQFVSFLFVPIYFTGIALNVDFISHFDPLIVFSVLAVACVGKLVGSFSASRLAGLTNRESLAVCVCMNARGAVEIILANVALENKLIKEPVFVALVIMAISTSMLPGPLLVRILGRSPVCSFTSFIPPNGFLPDIRATTSEGAIKELCSALGLESHAANVVSAEAVDPTGNDNGVALPHALVVGLAAPRIAVGLSRDGVDFDAPNRVASKVIILVLAPRGDIDAQHDLLEDITRFTDSHQFVEELLRVRRLTELFALVKVKRSELTR